MLTHIMIFNCNSITSIMLNTLFYFFIIIYVALQNYPSSCFCVTKNIIFLINVKILLNLNKYSKNSLLI